MNTPAPGYYWARLMFDPKQWVIIRIYDDLWWSCRSCEHPVTGPEQILEWGEKIVRCNCVLPEYVEVPDNPEYHRRQPADTIP